jgi:hypothetical protein
MFEYISKLFTQKKSPRRAAGFKPMFDDLESRQLMSVSSAAIHAVAPPVPGGQASVFYFDSKHELALNGEELPQNIKDTPHGITQFSAGLDAIGDVDVFVQASDKSVWKWNEGDWTKVLGPANGVKSFAAVDGDRAYAIYNTGALHEFDGSVWSKVPGSTTVTAIDAITDGRGNDAVFALNTNGTFGEYFGGHFDEMMPPTVRMGIFTAHLGTFSAATDQFGDAIVYGSLIGRFGRFNADFGVYQIGFGGTRTFIASGPNAFSGTTGALWIDESNGTLEKFDSTGLHQEPVDNGVVSFSAAGPDDVFYVTGQTLSETTISPNGFTEVVSYDDYGVVKQ